MGKTFRVASMRPATFIAGNSSRPERTVPPVHGFNEARDFHRGKFAFRAANARPKDGASMRPATFIAGNLDTVLVQSIDRLLQ